MSSIMDESSIMDDKNSCSDQDRRKPTTSSEFADFHKDIALHIICKTYDKFSKFIRFLPMSIKCELQEYLFLVFLHIYMHLLMMDRKYDAYEFYTSFAIQFCSNRSQAQATKDLQRFKNYEQAIVHPYIKQFGFSSQKYVIKLLRNSHDVLTSWFKDNKSTFIEEIIDINTSSDIYEESSVEKQLAIHPEAKADEKHEKQDKTKTLDLDTMLTDKAKICDKVLHSSVSGNSIAANTSLSFEKRLELLENVTNNSSEGQQNRALTIRDESTNTQTSSSSLLQIISSPPERTRPEGNLRGVPEVCLLTAKGCTGMLTCADIADDGSFVFGGFINEIRAWDMQYKMYDKVSQYQVHSDTEGDTSSGFNSRTEKATVFKGHAGVVNGISYERAKKLLLSGSEDRTIKVWSLKDYKCMGTYTFHSAAVIDLCSSSKTSYFASASADWTAGVWNYNYNRPLVQYSRHEGEISCIGFHPNCNYVATGSEDQTVHLWKTTDAELVRLFPGHDEKVTCVAFSPCGSYLATADVYGNLKVWDIKSGQQLSGFLAHENVITSVSYSKSGTFLAVGGFGGCLKIYDLQNLEAPLPQEEEDARFYAAVNDSFKGYYHRSPLELLSDFSCSDRDVFYVTFVKNNLLMGMAEHSYFRN